MSLESLGDVPCSEYLIIQDLLELFHITKVFTLKEASTYKNYVLLYGTLFTQLDCVIGNIYAPNDPWERVVIWEKLCRLKQKYPVPWCLAGDFYEIRRVGERKG